MNGWIVVNIGCIECGVSSDIVGIYPSETEAKTVANACQAALSWREGGQNAFDVFDLSAPQSGEYAAAIAKAQGAG
jgi:hypothetical protein